MYQKPALVHASQQRQVRACAALWLLGATLSSLCAAVGPLLNALQPLASLEVTAPALGLSLGRWPVLRRQLRLAAWWVVLSAAIWGLGRLAMLLLLGAHLSGALPSLALAALRGLLQARLLRRVLSQARTWVLVSGLGAAVGASAQRWLSFWTVYATVSGAGLLLPPGRWPEPAIGPAAQRGQRLLPRLRRRRSQDKAAARQGGLRSKAG